VYVILIFAGRPEEAIESLKQAMRLSPRYPVNYLSYLGMAYRLAGRPEEAIATLQRALRRNPEYLAPHFHLAVLYSELGRLEEARAEGAEFLRLSPNFSVEWLKQFMAFKDPAEVERYVTGLRKAGLK
jgi:adenylate cyclase